MVRRPPRCMAPIECAQSPHVVIACEPRSMETRAKTAPGGGGDVILNGSKNWITNSPIADVFVVWAKDDAGTIRGYILEKVCACVCVARGAPVARASGAARECWLGCGRCCVS